MRVQKIPFITFFILLDANASLPAENKLNLAELGLAERPGQLTAALGQLHRLALHLQDSSAVQNRRVTASPHPQAGPR